MTKNEIIATIASKTGYPKASCEQVLDIFAEQVRDSLIKGEKVILKDFMIFEISVRPERKGRNPKTGDVVTFPAVKTIKCKICKAIKEAVNAK